MRHPVRIAISTSLLALLLSAPALLGDAPARDEVLKAMRKAAGFFAEEVALHGGYQRGYSEDLSYAMAGKGSEGLNQFSVTGGTTPTVGLAYLRAWEVTGDDFYLKAARAAGGGLVHGQLCSGGWDYTTELDPKKRVDYDYRVDGDCKDKPIDAAGNQTNLDNNSTQEVLHFLMRLDQALSFEDDVIHEAVHFTLDGLLRAQYPNGAWPQRFQRPADPAKYPVKPAGYPDSWSKEWPGPEFDGHYTINDDVIQSTVDVLLEASRIYKDARYQVAAEKAGDFLILAQMPDPQPAWAQQYDSNMHPAWARIFEPPGVTGRESISAMRTLIFLYRETGKERFLEPIPRALDYLRSSVFEHNGRKVIARFYEMKTNRPLFVTKGTLVGTGVKFGQPTDGYKVVYDSTAPAAHYGYFGGAESIEQVQAEYDAVRAADPATLRRPERLEGSSAAQRQVASAQELAPQVAASIAAMDARGAWVQDGDLGGPGRLVRVRAAQDLVAVIDGKTFPVPDGSTLEVFEGQSPPSKRMISSGAFATNLGLFCDYLAGLAAK